MRRREKERVWENFLRDYSWKFPQHGKQNSQSSPRGTNSAIQDKPKEKHAETHINQTKTKHKERILKAAREKQQITHKGNLIHLTADLSAQILQARREWQDIFKVQKGKKKKKKYNQDYCTWQGFHSKLMEKYKAFQTSKS